jgi:hypothetical protein
MKTRQEMIYDFMLALASDWDGIENSMLLEEESVSDEHVADAMFHKASALADKYLEKAL